MLRHLDALHLQERELRGKEEYCNRLQRELAIQRLCSAEASQYALCLAWLLWIVLQLVGQCISANTCIRRQFVYQAQYNSC